MTEHQPEKSAKEVIKVHVEYKDKDGNVYSINDVEVPVETTLKIQRTHLQTLKKQMLYLAQKY